MPQDGASHTFADTVPEGTKRVAVIVASRIENGSNSTGVPAAYTATATLTDFRLGIACDPPPVPMLEAAALLIDNTPTIKLFSA